MFFLILDAVGCLNFIAPTLGLSSRLLVQLFVLGLLYSYQAKLATRIYNDLTCLSCFRAAERAGALLRLFDADGDGYLSFDEFRGMQTT